MYTNCEFMIREQLIILVNFYANLNSFRKIYWTRLTLQLQRNNYQFKYFVKYFNFDMRQSQSILSTHIFMFILCYKKL